MAVTAKIEGGKLIITADLETPTPSKSGKTLMVCSTRGDMKTDVTVDGKVLTIGLTAKIEADIVESAVPEKTDASPADYLDHAREINAIARHALRCATRDAAFLAGKISLGLSLQAGELAGKAMLRSLGDSTEQIRRDHAAHILPFLLDAVETKLQARSESDFKPYHHFLLETFAIDGIEHSTTYGEYLDWHFSKGESAKPRSYFYPDDPGFIGPEPIQALLVMVDHLIDVAGKVEAVVASLSVAT